MLGGASGKRSSSNKYRRDFVQVVGLDRRGATVLRQQWSRGQIEARLRNTWRLIGRGPVGAHHLGRKQALGHDAPPMPAGKGQKNDVRGVEALAEVVQRPAMRVGRQAGRSARLAGVAPGGANGRLGGAPTCARSWRARVPRDEERPHGTIVPIGRSDDFPCRGLRGDETK